MKKIISTILALVVVLSMTACTTQDSTKPTNDTPTTLPVETIPSTEATTTETEPVVEPTQEETEPTHNEEYIGHELLLSIADQDTGEFVQASVFILNKKFENFAKFGQNTILISNAENESIGFIRLVPNQEVDAAGINKVEELTINNSAWYLYETNNEDGSKSHTLAFQSTENNNFSIIVLGNDVQILKDIAANIKINDF